MLELFGSETKIKRDAVNYYCPSIGHSFQIIYLCCTGNFCSFSFDLVLHWVKVSTCFLALSLAHPLEPVPEKFIAMLIDVGDSLSLCQLPLLEIGVQFPHLFFLLV